MNPRPKRSGEGGEGLQLRPHTRERTKLQTLPTLPKPVLREGGEDLHLRPHTRDKTKVQNLPTLPKDGRPSSERAPLSSSFTHSSAHHTGPRPSAIHHPASPTQQEVND